MRNLSYVAIVLSLMSFSRVDLFSQPLAKKSDAGTYSVPFASESNRIELEVVNSTDLALEDLTIELSSSPSWVRFESESAPIGTLEAAKSHMVVFEFDQEERAPVGDVASIEFEVLSSTGLMETRTITIEPEAPTELTLRGNYPNPFNPSTKIAYALPQDGSVEIEVFNAIGQRVTRLVDQFQQAGYQDATWNAAGVPSGVYFYSVELNAEGKRQVKLGKMILLK